MRVLSAAANAGTWTNEAAANAASRSERMADPPIAVQRPGVPAVDLGSDPVSSRDPAPHRLAQDMQPAMEEMVGARHYDDRHFAQRRPRDRIRKQHRFVAIAVHDERVRERVAAYLAEIRIARIGHGAQPMPGEAAKRRGDEHEMLELGARARLHRDRAAEGESREPQRQVPRGALPLRDHPKAIVGLAAPPPL